MKINKKMILFLLGVTLFAVLVAGCTPARRPDTTPDTQPNNRTTPKDNIPDNTTPDTTTPDDIRPDDNRTPGVTDNNIRDENTKGTQTGDRTTPGDMTDDDRTRTDEAEKISNEVADLKEIDSATCVITGDTAMVGVQFDDQYKGELTDDI